MTMSPKTHRSKTSRTAAAGLAILLVSVPVLADSEPGAPKDQYEFFIRTSPTVQDHYTRLLWDRSARTGLAYDAAVLYCQGRMGGSRIPTAKELLTILDEQPHSEYEFGELVEKMIDQLAFPDSPVDTPYFTSTVGAGGQRWVVSFADGNMALLAPSATATVRCVK